MQIQYPQFNGNRFSWSSAFIAALGKQYTGVKSLNYSQEVAPGEVFGTHGQKIGRTRGEAKPEGTIELYKEEAAALIADLGDGFYEVEFDVVASWEEGDLVVTDTLQRCRIKKVDDSHSQGSDALTVKLDLDVMLILYNGKKPLKNMLNGIL